MRSTILAIHICAGVVGVLTGAGAIFFRKGSRRHGLSGNVFFGAMLVMGTTASYLSVEKGRSVLGGFFVCYLVTTAWSTARRRHGETSILDWGGVAFALAFGVLSIMSGIELMRTGTKSPDGAPVGMIFFLGSIGLLAAAGDVRMIVSGLSGSRRIARHLWRMCFSFFIATGSFFLGQQQVFPKAWRGSALWLVPALFPLVALVYWMIRVRPMNTNYLTPQRLEHSPRQNQP
jgi:hypothetical protein